MRSLLLILVTVMLAGCTMEEFETDTPLFTEAIQEKNPSKCKEINENAQFLCFMTIALDTQDASLCFEIPKEEQRDSCLLSVATATNNPSICEDITQDDKMRQCKQALGMQAMSPDDVPDEIASQMQALPDMPKGFPQ